MTSSRPSPFSNKIDVSGFAPKTGPDDTTASPEAIEQVSEQAGFHSRTPQPRASKHSAPSSKRSAIVRSKYVVPLNARVSERGHERIHQILDAEWARYERGEITHRVTIGELVERAFDALEREMQQEAKKK
jgi:hypothetical protein